MANKDVRLRIKKQHIHINTLTFIHTPSYPARRTLHNEDGLTSQLQSPPCNHNYILPNISTKTYGKQTLLEKPNKFDPFGQKESAHLIYHTIAPLKVLVMGVNFILPF